MSNDINNKMDSTEFILYDKISELKRRTHHSLFNKSSILLLELFCNEKCKAIDEQAQTNPHILKQRRDILNLLANCDENVSEEYENAFAIYNEIQVYYLLHQKCNSIEFVPKERGVRTPDFLMKCSSGNFINLELKTISFRKSIENFTNIQKEMKSIDENNIKWLQSSALGVDKGEMASYTRRNVIEQLSDRILKHLKKGLDQIHYQDRSGVLVIDTEVLKETLMIYIQDALPGFVTTCYFSGCLWNAVFGKIDDLVFQCIKPAANIKHDPFPAGGERLRRNGVLVDAENLSAIIFIVKTASDRDENRIVGFSRSNLNDPDILESLNVLCDFKNDEINSNINKIAAFRFKIPEFV